MVDDRPEDTGSLPDSERPKRAPPTIDLEATDVSTATSHADGAAKYRTRRRIRREPVSEAPVRRPRRRRQLLAISPWIVAPVSGAVAAALVIGVGWMLGWPAVQPAAHAAPAVNAAAIDDLTARIAGLESKAGKPVADPAAAARVEGLEKSLAPCAVNSLRPARKTTSLPLRSMTQSPHRALTAPRAPDLSAVDERIAKVESLVRTQGAEIAQQGSKIADAKAADGKPADDLPLRRVVASRAARRAGPDRRSLSGGAGDGESAGAQSPMS